VFENENNDDTINKIKKNFDLKIEKLEENTKKDLNDVFFELKEKLIETTSTNKQLFEENEKKYLELKEIEEEIKTIQSSITNNTKLLNLNLVLNNPLVYETFLKYCKDNTCEE
jgi:hypothetical protein